MEREREESEIGKIINERREEGDRIKVGKEMK